MKLATMVIMVLLMGAVVKRGPGVIMQFAGGAAPGAGKGAGDGQFSSEESDLMSTVFQSALRLFSGSASREELAGELSDKLYSGRASAGDMSELGIELVKPGENPAAPKSGAGLANLPPGVNPSKSQPVAGAPNAPVIAGAKPLAKKAVPPGAASAKVPTAKDAEVVGGRLAQFWKRVKAYTVELALIPVVFMGMFLVHRVRRRAGKEDAFMLPDLANLMPSETEHYDMKHAVHALSAEDFEMLVALIYQRQGYRVSMPAALSGGRGGDFTLLRKSERLLVQCKKLSQEHKIPVERVRELHEAVSAAGATRGLFVASCGFSWDARNYGKAKGLTLIGARTLDSLIDAARESPNEDLLAVSNWVPKLMSKVKLTPPLCPACEAAMDQVNATAQSVWVCSQRPDCRGRRCGRKHQKPVATAVENTDKPANGVTA